MVARSTAVAAAVCAVMVAGPAGAATRAAPAVTGWRRAIEVPGTAQLNIGGNATVRSVSCTAPGTCAAGGSFGSDRLDQNATQAFVVSQRGGAWAKALKVPGTRGLGALDSEILSVSCASAGNCAAGGDYVDTTGSEQALIVSERNGRWGKALEVPGTAALNAFGEAQVLSVSCPSAGRCVAAGFYSTGPGLSNAFVASQRDGRWGNAKTIPGLRQLDKDHRARIYSVSCPAAGNCAAGGFYLDAQGRWQAFVVTERGGRWGSAIEVPGTSALNIGGDANVDSVSCASEGNCAAVGYYEASKYNGSTATWQAFAANERDGHWGRAVALLRHPSVNDNTVGAAAETVSCSTASTCSAGGAYLDRSGRLQALVASEHSGRWGKAIEVPGSARLNTGGQAEVFSVSCPSAGECTAGGYYRHGGFQAFVVSEHSGVWSRALEVPGTAKLNAGRGAAVDSVSCASASACSAGGGYRDSSHNGQAFVTSRA